METLLQSELLLQTVILLISVILLTKFSHIVISNAVKLAKITGLSELAIGFILLSVATSLPELAVSVTAIRLGEIGISIGNLFGSNITDICLVVGVVALVTPIKIPRWGFRYLSAILFLTSVIPVFLLVMVEASRLIGLFLLGLFIFFCFYSMKKQIIKRHNLGVARSASSEPRGTRIILLSLTVFLIGVGGVIISSNYAVDSAAKIASILKIAPSVIGATIVAVGTSLPELSVSLAALRTKHFSLALGDAIGACLTNMTLNLGIVLLAAPLDINMTIFTTLILFLLIANLFMWFFLESGKLSHFEGLTLLIIYQFFLVTTFGVQIAIR